MGLLQMTDKQLDRLKSLLSTIEAADTRTTVYDAAQETLRWRIEGEERKRKQAAEALAVIAAANPVVEN